MATMRSLKTYYINISTGRKYPIIMGIGAWSALHANDLTGAKKGLIVTNTTIQSACGDAIDALIQTLPLATQTVVLPDGESHKTMASVNRIIDACLDHGMGRHDVLLAVGGGVIGDMAGFAASIYLRGIPFFQVPTSLLAQVDAAIGGKTGVNHATGKNLIGAFYQPKKTVIDPSILASLSKEHMKEGLAEIIKYGVIMDKPLFWYIEEHVDAIQTFSYKDCPDVWHFLIEKSIQNKARVVSQDEKESEYREILNFGHTIGHALEVGIGYDAISHGQAVAYGMMAESLLARQLNHLSDDDYHRIIQVIQAFNYSVSFDGLSTTLFFEALKKDKKARQGVTRYVVPVGVGSTKTIQDVSDDDIQAVLDQLKAGALQ